MQKIVADSCCEPKCCSTGLETRQPDFKSEIRKQYGKLALRRGTEACCGPERCIPSGEMNTSQEQVALLLGYVPNDLKSIPKASILGVGCGAPLNFAEPEIGETVVDLGSGAGIDVFLSANRVGEDGKVIGIDMTDEMLEKARLNAKANGYSNAEFRKGDIETHVPVDDGSVDLVISNCVINLTTDKVAAFKQVHRILRNGGRMVISDLVTDKEIALESADAAKWCGCIDGALTKVRYIRSIIEAGFNSVEIMQERPYTDGAGVDGKKITSIIVKAVK